jgi:hypothetical protein
LRTLAFASLLVATACATVETPHSCRAGEDSAIAEMLYFGTAMQGGRVTNDDWQRFLADTITPRFPEGLTAWAAAGQWQNAAGELQKEDSYVLHVVHKDEAKFDTAVREVIAVYKSRFRQEAVLRVRTAACMAF